MECEILGVVIKTVDRHIDERGWLQELFRQDELESSHFPVMSYVSLTHPGRARGPHEHRDQTDCFAFLGPSTFRLYLWDNRPDSPSYQQKCVLDVGENHNVTVIVPPGVVHGYKNVGDTDGLVFNAPNRLYKGKGRTKDVDEIRYEERPDNPFAFDD